MEKVREESVTGWCPGSLVPRPALQPEGCHFKETRVLSLQPGVGTASLDSSRGPQVRVTREKGMTLDRALDLPQWGLPRSPPCLKNLSWHRPE
jgi:hypothetical protein